MADEAVKYGLPVAQKQPLTCPTCSCELTLNPLSRIWYCRKCKYEQYDNVQHSASFACDEDGPAPNLTAQKAFIRVVTVPITLRQHYIGQILSGAMGTGYLFSGEGNDRFIAKRCCAIADAVIAAEAGGVKPEEPNFGISPQTVFAS